MTIKNILLATAILFSTTHLSNAEIVFKKPPSKLVQPRINTSNSYPIDWSYYDITGNSLKEIRASLEANGPIDPKTNKHVWALSSWNFDWTGDCKVTLTTKIKMPRLSPENGLSDREFQIITDMIEALRKHEIGHYEIAEKTKKAIKHDNCRTPYKIHDFWSKEQALYDRKTNHGAITGVDLR